MNVEKLQCLIKEIENERLRDYLLSCLKSECELNSLNTPSVLIEKATQRFEKKIKVCQEIEKDLPNHLIADGDCYLLTKKLAILRLNLAILYTNKIYELNEDDYNEIKTFIFKILNFQNIHLKLKVFDLTIKLLEKANKLLKFSKDFIAVLDLLKLLINDPRAFKPEHLRSINNFHEKDIKKDFYGIVYELNQKIVFQDLLNQLSLIIRGCDKSLLMQFNLELITHCINDQAIDADDFTQLLILVFRSLKCYELVSKNGFSSIRNNILSPKSLTDYLLEFEKEFEEIIPKIKLELEKPLPNLSTEKPQESDISSYFPASIKNEKLWIKFNEVKSQIIEKNQNTESNVHFTLNFWKRFGELSSKASGLKVNAIVLATHATENLKVIAGTRTERLKEFIIKKTENSDLKGNEEITENGFDLKDSLIKAKDELSSVKKIIDIWKSKLNYLAKQSDTRIDTPPINLNQNPAFLVNALRSNIDEKFSELINKTVDELENTNAMSKRKGYWLAKPESNKPNFAKKVWIRGYFNIDFSIKKIKAKLGGAPSFKEITDFISKQSFWVLLFTFGIVRWPWINKTAFAHTWAEQLCLPEIIKETEELKSLALDNKEQFLENVIKLSEGFFLYKNQTIAEILQEFKSYIVITFGRLESINQKIEESLNESNYAPHTCTPINGLFGKISSQPKIDIMASSTIMLSA